MTDCNHQFTGQLGTGIYCAKCGTLACDCGKPEGYHSKTCRMVVAAIAAGWGVPPNWAKHHIEADLEIDRLDSALKDIAELAEQNGAEWCRKRALRALTP